jgi:hypothetical protein
METVGEPLFRAQTEHIFSNREERSNWVRQSYQLYGKTPKRKKRYKRSIFYVNRRK